MGWRVKNIRPEDLHSAEEFYTKEEVDRYANTNAIRTTQRKLAERIMELLDMKKGTVIDIGSGPGFTAEFFKEKGFDVTALDINEHMLDYCKKKNLKTVHMNMLELDKLNHHYDYAISVSAVQWLKTSDFKTFAKGLSNTADNIAIQFYPKDESTVYRLAKTLSKYFDVKVIVDNPNNPRKRTIFIVGKKTI
ncbi:hypothetical protein DRN75_02440 [Nanoarchaeota archaeon]|nr:MAG: hypothetical protein DRN75_02440 [Nanoarchaeota archaeon]